MNLYIPHNIPLLFHSIEIHFCRGGTTFIVCGGRGGAGKGVSLGSDHQGAQGFTKWTLSFPNHLAPLPLLSEMSP